VNGASPTLGDAASIFCSGEVEMVSQYPKDRGVGVNIYCLLFAVDVKVYRCHSIGICLKIRFYKG
jgi:hypothetical protein